MDALFSALVGMCGAGGEVTLYPFEPMEAGNTSTAPITKPRNVYLIFDLYANSSRVIMPNYSPIDMGASRWFSVIHTEGNRPSNMSAQTSQIQIADGVFKASLTYPSNNTVHRATMPMWVGIGVG